ncbi:MAG: hydrolase TatD [Candidatus Doudnabacteria bacterium CG10_big_fil_rev_8_21_14_0_10_42_18]|uniref:Hydrolase TatD n=1 Tax=Candidatus Doudnabacteria bacterium CG10_big_fil_rev_8_21_14_0_10_42_18 TaxID=1974552 RepID=A0A2H0VA50_9BACT|nr:MAG: hydrolase TatD [Candidatus Doudnabacteria bacterium CG10_big_fil_rev_8_21_14_0_10_42_18]
MLIDTHAHVNFKAFKDDAKETLQRSLSEGVWVNNVGTQIQTSRQAVELAGQFNEGVFATIGLHPVHTYSQHLDEEETSFQTKKEKFDYGAYHQLALNPKVVGIGECGLDYYRLPEDTSVHKKVKQLQKEAFISQIKLAKEADKALVVHSRSTKGTDDACLDILDILKQEGMDKHRFVLHSYTGSPEVLQKFLDIGGFVSFNGIITFDKTGNMEKLVKMAPLDKILVETDCPYLTPVPNRGKRNEPSFVKHTAEHLAKLKGNSFDEISKISTENAKKLFKFPSP